MTSAHRVVCLVGFPNSGKTTLFNRLTGLTQKVVNYPGSTVDIAYAPLKNSPHTTIIDTPGITSLSPASIDESETIQVLSNVQRICQSHTPHPDWVAVVIDVTQLERQLVLIRQLQRRQFQVCAILTKGDLTQQVFDTLDIPKLKKGLNIPLTLVSGKTGNNLTDLLNILNSTPPPTTADQTPTETTLFEDFRWAESLAQQVIRTKKESTWDWDQLFLHPIFGLLCFIGIMGGFFWMIFAMAAPFTDLIDQSVAKGAEAIQTTLPDTWLRSLLSDGLLAGIGAVAVFIPQIFFLFLGIHILESSGYLARAAMIMDRPLSWIGLNGRSFVPLLSGCACALPAMMAARTIPNRKERLLTLFIIPLMSCSARLPVYGLLLALLLGNNAKAAGFGLLLIYIASFTIASATAAIAGRFLGAKEHSHFQIELPRWHIPVLKDTLLNAMRQTWRFCEKAGPIIATLSIALWLASTFPSPEHSVVHYLSALLDPILHPMGIDGRVGIALLLAFAAREVFVSALMVVFAVQNTPDGLISALQFATFSNGDPIFTMPTIIALILFFMVSMQCLSTVAVARSEMGQWRLPIIMTITYITLAYALAVLAHTILRHF